MAKDLLDSLSGAVPAAIAAGGLGGRAAPGRRRGAHPLGSREAIGLLARVPLFAGLSRRELRQLAEHADQVRYREREAIVHADQPGGTFYVIVEGETRVVRGGRTLSRLGPGEFFGEISLLDGGPRTASVLAETPVTAIRIFKRSFDRVVSQEPSVAAKILAVVARRLREAERSING